MQLVAVDKVRYRQRLNRITVLSIAALLLVSLGSSTLLIQLLGTPGGSNFWLNLTGVIIGCLVVGFSLKRLRHQPYFAEVAYIWDLKHELNLIQRKLKAVQTAAEQNDPTALLVLAYSYAGSRLIWQLDDNTLMMSELNLADNKLQEQAAQLGLKLELDAYRRELLARF